MNTWEKGLALWVALCMGAGVLLSQLVPGIGETLDSWQVRGISIPIGVCLFLMMYPALLNLRLDELKKLRRNPRPILLTLLSNWLVAPLVMFLLARLFLSEQPQLMVAAILLGSSPCTAMVLVWGRLARGNQEQNVINTSLNTLTIMVLYVPVVGLLTGLQGIPVDRVQLAISALVFIGFPLLLGIVTRRAIVRARGEAWFHGTFRPAVEKVSIAALLTTLVVLFSLNGDVLVHNLNYLVLISIPLLLHYVLILGYNLVATRAAGLAYPEGIITVIIGSSSHFEIAIATAVAMYGVGSVAALGTTMGLFWEVPLMLGVVAIGKRLGAAGFWRGARYDPAALAPATEPAQGTLRGNVSAQWPAGTVGPSRTLGGSMAEPRARAEIREEVRQRYGEVVRLRGAGCCSPASGCCGGSASADVTRHAERLGYTEGDVRAVPEGPGMSLGCGNPGAIAALRAGEVVLDLGSGGGFDCFLAARKVGETGRVIGVDMTPDMLVLARENAGKMGCANVEFRLGEIEHLPVADGTVDVILSNCVVNLSPDKPAVFGEAYRVLKPGGRLAIADTVATAPLPEEARRNLALWASCLSGAATIDELEAMLGAAGFTGIRIEPRDASRELIREWVPGSGVEAYVVSATIEATKPLR